eukprot:618395-Hanusia_phi.AAC.1
MPAGQQAGTESEASASQEVSGGLFKRIREQQWRWGSSAVRVQVCAGGGRMAGQWVGIGLSGRPGQHLLSTSSRVESRDRCLFLSITATVPAMMAGPRAWPGAFRSSNRQPEARDD